MNRATKIYILYSTVVLAATLAGCGIEIVDTGHRGVKTRFGEIIEPPLVEGFYTYNPFTSTITEYDVRIQRWEGDTITYTKDVQQATIKFVMNLNPEPAEITTLIREVGVDWESKLVSQVVLDALKEVVGKWDAVDLISNREKAKATIRDLIVDRLAAKHIIISGFDITDIEYTDEFEKAVEAKVVAIQSAIEEVNRTQQKQELAKQVVIKAEAEARSIKIRGESLANNPKLVEWEKVQKWDGKLPQYVLGGAVPFISMK